MLEAKIKEWLKDTLNSLDSDDLARFNSLTAEEQENIAKDSYHKCVFLVTYNLARNKEAQ